MPTLATAQNIILVIVIPADLARTITAAHPHEGPLWLHTLPTLIADCARQWQLIVEDPFPDLSYTFVAPARCVDGAEAVLKIGISHAELSHEIEALRLFEGRGAVALLRADKERGALLLQRLRPGTPLVTLEDDDQATLVAASVMRRLWHAPPANHAFPTVADWTSGLNKYYERFTISTGPIPARLLSKAEELIANLLASAPGSVLLHGDVHHFNIVSAGPNQWVAIDPKGVVGEPAYEIARFLHNPPGILAKPQAGRLVKRRVTLMSEALGLDPKRLWAWGFCKMILSAWWCLEDGQDAFLPYCITAAELMDAMV